MILISVKNRTGFWYKITVTPIKIKFILSAFVSGLCACKLGVEDRECMWIISVYFFQILLITLLIEILIYIAIIFIEVKYISIFLFGSYLFTF